MAFERVGSLASLPAGSMMEVESGGRKVVVCNTGDQLYAMNGVCPHRGGPLAEGALHGTMVVCPWHAWEFDCVTGQNDYNPGIKQEKFTVRMEGNEILLDLP
jgi:nitrite reductase/ring-hydroxylating ferredoxin subunit